MPVTNEGAFLVPAALPQYVRIKNNPQKAVPIVSIEKEIISDKISIRS